MGHNAFTVFARPADALGTPEFYVLDGPMLIGQPFRKREEALADAARRQEERDANAH